MQCGCQNLGQVYQNCYSAGRLKTIEIRSNIHFAIFSSGRRFIFFAIFLIGNANTIFKMVQRFKESVQL